MRKLDLDLLLVGGFRSRDHYEHNLSNDYIEGVVVFPLAAVHASALRALLQDAPANLTSGESLILTELQT